jgi:hypothetical protein
VPSADRTLRVELLQPALPGRVSGHCAGCRQRGGGEGRSILAVCCAVAGGAWLLLAIGVLVARLRPQHGAQAVSVPGRALPDPQGGFGPGLGRRGTDLPALDTASGILVARCGSPPSPLSALDIATAGDRRADRRARDGRRARSRGRAARLAGHARRTRLIPPRAPERPRSRPCRLQSCGIRPARRPARRRDRSPNVRRRRPRAARLVSGGAASPASTIPRTSAPSRRRMTSAIGAISSTLPSWPGESRAEAARRAGSWPDVAASVRTARAGDLTADTLRRALLQDIGALTTGRGDCGPREAERSGAGSRRLRGRLPTVPGTARLGVGRRSSPSRCREHGDGARGLVGRVVPASCRHYDAMLVGFAESRAQARSTDRDLALGFAFPPSRCRRLPTTRVAPPPSSRASASTTRRVRGDRGNDARPTTLEKPRRTLTSFR